MLQLKSLKVGGEYGLSDNRIATVTRIANGQVGFTWFGNGGQKGQGSVREHVFMREAEPIPGYNYGVTEDKAVEPPPSKE